MINFPQPAFGGGRDAAVFHSAFPKIDAGFEALQLQRKIPGVAYGVVVDGTLVFAGSHGLAHIGENRLASPESVYRIASMTKSLTAMSLIRLRDEGRLRFESPAEEYVPELAALQYPTHDSALITVHQLMTMGAGFPQDDPWADRQLALREEELSALLVKGIAFSNPPGTTFEYSNLGYAILGRIVTNVAGEPYQAYVKEHILSALGMDSSTFDIQEVDPARLAMGYKLVDNEWVEEPPLSDGAFASIGGLFTTITDFARYMAFFLDAYPPRNDEESGPIRRSSAREMQTMMRPWLQFAMRENPTTPLVIRTVGYAYGLMPNYDSRLGYTVAHGGGLPGYGTFYKMLPEYGVGVVAFTNLTYAGADGKVQEALLALKETGALRPRQVPASTAIQDVGRAFAALYDQWDDANADSLFTDTFWMDAPRERRRAQLETIRMDLGARLTFTGIEAENALRGLWRMDCERGTLDVFLTLSPTVPPKVQYWLLTPAKPIGAALSKAFRGLIRLANNWDEPNCRKVFGARFTLNIIREQCAALQVQYGRLWLGNTLEGDGINRARVRLEGEQGSIDATITLDGNGKIRELTFSKPREVKFML